MHEGHGFVVHAQDVHRRAACRIRHAAPRIAEGGRAWAIKEVARQLWSYTSRTWATKGWRAWLGWAQTLAV